MDKTLTENRFGFTLIEILVVIAIIGMLAVALVPMVLDAPAKARDTQRIEEARKIANFFMEYSVSNSLPTGGYHCLRPGDAYGNIIQDNIAAFGGAYPKEPGGKPIAQVCSYNGEYYYYIYNLSAIRPDSPYSFLVLTPIENFENGNYPFIGGTGFVFYNFIDGDPGVTLGEEGNYYFHVVTK